MVLEMLFPSQIYNDMILHLGFMLTCLGGSALLTRWFRSYSGDKDREGKNNTAKHGSKK